MLTVLGPDVSHYQGSPNFPAVASAGFTFAMMKATEGLIYSDPTFSVNRLYARNAKLLTGFYHFARGNDPTGEAHHFCDVVGGLAVGDLLALDWEIAGADPPSWCLAWLDTVQTRTGVKPFVYMNTSAVNGSNWGPVAAADYGLWLAKYDNTSQTSVPYWGTPAMKQFTDHAAIPGIAGPCDENIFYGTRTQLLAYGAQATPPPEDPMPTADEIAHAVWWGPESRVSRKNPDGTINYTPALQEMANIHTDLTASTLDPQKVADLIISSLPAADAQKVADLVIVGLGQRLTS